MYSLAVLLALFTSMTDVKQIPIHIELALMKGKIRSILSRWRQTKSTRIVKNKNINK